MAEFRIDRDGDLWVGGVSTCVVVPADQVAELRELITPAAEVAAPAPSWSINADTMLCFGDHHIYFHTDQVSEDIDAENAAEPRTFGDMADWLIQHQPAATLEQVQAWGRYDEAAPHVHAFIQQQISEAQAAPAEPASTPAAPAGNADPIWRYEVRKDEDDEYLYHRSSSSYVFQLSSTADEAAARELGQWFVQRQPAISEDDRKYLVGDTKPIALSRACVVKLTEIRAAIEAGTYEPLPFTPDRAEVSDDPAFWQQVAEAEHAPRLVHVSFTFDPADYAEAADIYRVINDLPYKVRERIDIH